MSRELGMCGGCRSAVVPGRRGRVAGGPGLPGDFLSEQAGAADHEQVHPVTVRDVGRLPPSWLRRSGRGYGGGGEVVGAKGSSDPIRVYLAGWQGG